jgi:hypothetical protein
MIKSPSIAKNISKKKIKKTKQKQTRPKNKASIRDILGREQNDCTHGMRRPKRLRQPLTPLCIRSLHSPWRSEASLHVLRAFHVPGNQKEWERQRK